MGRIPFPREHGAWAVLLASLLLALAHPWARDWPALVLALLFVLAFAIQEPLRAMAAGRGRGKGIWLLVYGTLIAVGALYLYLGHEVRVLIPAVALGFLVTAIDLGARRYHLHRRAVFRLIGVAALTLALPGLLCIVHPERAGYAFLLWAMVVIYFTSRLTYIRAVIAARRGENGSLATVWAAQAALYAALVVIVLLRLAPAWILAAFVPATLVIFLPLRDTSLRRAGWREALLLLWFVAAVLVGYHIGGFDTLAA